VRPCVARTLWGPIMFFGLRKNLVCRLLGLLANLILVFPLTAFGPAACTWAKETGRQRSGSSAVDSLAARAFDNLAFEGSEVFLTLIPVDYGEPDQPQICLYQVNFWRQALEDNGPKELLQQQIRSLNAYAFTKDDVASLLVPPKEGQPSPVADEKESGLARERATLSLKNILVGLGRPELAESCGKEQQDVASGWFRFFESGVQRFSQAKKREHEAIFGPLSPLFVRATDAGSIEPLPAAEYLLILDRLTRYALREDLRELSTRKAVPCFQRPFPLDERLEKLKEIANAFPPPKGL
jgi:hypothetical protein